MADRSPHRQWADPAAQAALRLFAAEDDETAWQDFAACAETDPEAFFPEKGGSVKDAKRVCMMCPSRAECLEYALANPHLTAFGIWGGKSERERRRMRQGQVAA